MNTLGISTTHAVRRLAVVTIVVALALSFAAIVTLAADSNVSISEMFAALGDYLNAAGEALGSL